MSAYELLIILKQCFKKHWRPVKSHKAVHGVAIALSMADGIPTEGR